jgi:hypothetical protein
LQFAHLLAAIQFVPLDPSSPKFFGFSELLAGLALMVLAWTIADSRYRFRVSTAPLPLQRLTFVVVLVVGVLTLLTDLWRAQSLPVPEGNVLTPSGWQAILAGTFLFTFLAWAWFAFIRPPTYGKANALRYARALYRVILRGSPSELAVVADELAFSAKKLIRHAAELKFSNHTGNEKERPVRLPTATNIANDLLLLIGDVRFCRAIVESSPGTALAIFREIAETRKYGVRVKQFAKNIVNEALRNKDSFLFHEAEGYESGLLGYLKPLSQAMFSSYHMVEAIGTMLDPDFETRLDAVQLKAYCRVVLMTFRDYVANDFYSHSFVLYRACDYIGNVPSDLYKLNGTDGIHWENDLVARVRVVVDFIQSAVDILDKRAVPEPLKSRLRSQRSQDDDFYDHLAKMICGLISSASAVRSNIDSCWWIQHNTVWAELFNFGKLDGPAGKIVKFKVRRRLWKEVADMNKVPNFKGAEILGFCLNVMGLKVRGLNWDRDSRPLHKAILSWVKKNYSWLHSINPRVAAATLVDAIAYDSKNLRLVKTFAAGLNPEPDREYLIVNAPPRKTGRRLTSITAPSSRK